jgi:signal transduction histidine kinase
LRREWLEEASRRYFETTAPIGLRETFVDLLEGKLPTVASNHADSFFRASTFIEVEDWGCGMSMEDLRSKFLTIGTPNRALERVRLGPNSKLLGEKGIGRLSAMRLGLTTEVTTGTLNDSYWSTLVVDWSKLREDPDLDLDEFQVEPERGDAKKRGVDQGTLLRISNLQADWSLRRLAALGREELSKLQDPFDVAGAVLDLSLTFNGQDIAAVQELDRELLNEWHGHFKVSFSYEKVNPDDPKDYRLQPMLKGIAQFRVPSPSVPDNGLGVIDEKEISATGDGLFSLSSSTEYPVSGGLINDAERFAGIDTLGPFTAEGYWFNRQRARKELGERSERFKAWLEQWAGGLLMYRDGYRVYPYASPDDDWLELDQRALRRRSFKLNRGQFVGYVRISSRNNPELRDQTNRQGLCDTPEKRALVQSLQHVIWKELGALVSSHEERATRQSLATVREIEQQMTTSARDAKGRLRELARRAPQERETVAQLRGYVEELEAAWAAAKKAIKQQAGQAEMYMHLAGVGMLLEFVIHELNRVTGATLQDLQSVAGRSLPPGLRSLHRQLQTLDKRLRILDPVSTPGRQRREDADIVEVLQTLIEAHEQQFERHEIQASIAVQPANRTLSANVVVGQMYQIFENLISNSVYWLSHHRSIERVSKGPDFKAKIEIRVDVNARTVSFRDNGPGIEWADREKIFEPFFSKKPAGRGIGLYIVRSLCNENGIVLTLLPRSTSGTVPGFLFEMP